MGQPHWFVISTPQGYEDLCKRQLDIFDRGETMRYIFKDFLGEGIIAVDGHKWLQQRKAASHLFLNRMMREIMDAQVIEKSIQFRDVLEACTARGKPVGLKALTSKFPERSPSIFSGRLPAPSRRA
jgi:cytochrome P450